MYDVTVPVNHYRKDSRPVVGSFLNRLAHEGFTPTHVDDGEGWEKLAPSHHPFASPMSIRLVAREMVTAVDPMTAYNGPIRLIPGSHVHGHLPVDPETRRLPSEAIDSKRAITVEMAPGDVLLFGPYTIHGSAPNVSRTSRRAFLNGFCIPGANRRIYPGDGAGRTVVAPFD